MRFRPSKDQLSIGIVIIRDIVQYCYQRIKHDQTPKKKIARLKTQPYSFKGFILLHHYCKTYLVMPLNALQFTLLIGTSHKFSYYSRRQSLIQQIRCLPMLNFVLEVSFILAVLYLFYQNGGQMYITATKILPMLANSCLTQHSCNCGKKLLN